MGHHLHTPNTMDLKKLLNEPESIAQTMAAQYRADGVASIVNAARSGVLGLESTAAERQAVESALGISGQAMADTMRKDFERTVGLGDYASREAQTIAERLQSEIDEASRAQGAEQASYLQNLVTLNIDEIERQGREAHQKVLSDMAHDSAQDMARQAAEFRRRENAKLEYARRSAEASEEVLAEERKKREAAEIAAKEAKAERLIAEQRADRAEKREDRAIRLAIIGLIIGVVGAFLGAWPFIKDRLDQ